MNEPAPRTRGKGFRRTAQRPFSGARAAVAEFEAGVGGAVEPAADGDVGLRQAEMFKRAFKMPAEPGDLQVEDVVCRSAGIFLAKGDREIERDAFTADSNCFKDLSYL